jgi:rhamnosyl/mannosyltransferase
MRNLPMVDNRLKILEVNKLYYPHIGGIETVIQSISENLKDRADVQVLVCQPKGKGSVDVVNGVTVTRCSSLGTYFSMPVSFEFIRKFKQMAKTSDIVHIHVPFPLGDLACLLSGYKGKVVIYWHSDVVKQKKLLKLYKPIMERFLKRADCIVVATQGHIDGSPYISRYAEKCKIIPYGLNLEDYIITGDLLTQKLHDKSNLKVLFVGRLVYYKGVDVLVKAFAKVTGCELFIVGTGKLENELKTIADGMENSVHFLGSLSDENLKKALSDCDIFVLPSVENSEAFGIVQMEAMVYGKPVVNTSLPTGVPHVSLDGVTGITVEPSNVDALAKAIQSLVDDDQLRTLYGKNARERVLKTFDNRTIMDDIYNLYCNLAEDK